MMRADILLIEDDPDIAESIQEYLKNTSAGEWTVHLADNGPDGIGLAKEESYALILLDVNLPGLDGFRVCRTLREAGIRTPVIFLTARFAEEDALRGYECGGDDYLVKPFSLAQLAAKVRALLARLYAEASGTVRYRDLTLERSRGRIALRGEELKLPLKEYEILAYFLEHPRRLIGRETLIEQVWGWDGEILSRNLDNHIKNLRKEIAGSEASIVTVRKQGYRFE